MEKKLFAVISDDRFGTCAEEQAVFDPLGIELRVCSCVSSEDVAAACADADALLVNMAPIDKAALSAMKNCKVISRYGVGLDNVDTEECRRRGISVYNVPDYCGPEVAEHALALLLNLLRGIGERTAAIRMGQWNIASEQRVIYDSVVGIAGFGKLGQEFARRIAAFSPRRIVVWSPSVSERKLDSVRALYPGVCFQALAFPELLAVSDYLSIHLALNEQTRHIFDERAFSGMKRGIYIINTARGALIDSAALVSALQTGIAAGAGLDVFENEPLQKNHPLAALPNVLMSDHNAYRSGRSIAELKRRCAENAVRGLRRNVLGKF